MTSIMTNSAAIAALQTLRSLEEQLNNTQQVISSGYRVGSAADNAAYWSIATTMRSDNEALGAVNDALGLAAAKTDIASSGLKTSIDILSNIKTKLVAAREPGADKDKINREITELKNQLITVAQSSSFSGENWLYNGAAAAIGVKDMVGGFIRDENGNVSVQTISYDTSASVLLDSKVASRGLLTKANTVTVATGTTTTTATYFLINLPSTTAASGTQIAISSATTSFDIDGMTAAVDGILTNVTNAATTLGAVTKRVSMQSTFVQNLQDTVQKGIGRLVDADMNEESTRLKALQTQQQLGIQALSIANNGSQNILQLFR